MEEIKKTPDTENEYLLEVKDLVKWFPIKSSFFKQTVGNVRRGHARRQAEHRRRHRRDGLHQGRDQGRQRRSGCRRGHELRKGERSMNFNKQLKDGLIYQNPVLVQVLGMCSTMAIDRINKINGPETIIMAAQQYPGGKNFSEVIKHDFKSKNPTTRWSDIIRLK